MAAGHGWPGQLTLVVRRPKQKPSSEETRRDKRITLSLIALLVTVDAWALKREK